MGVDSSVDFDGIELSMEEKEWREQCATVRREYECRKIYDEVIGVIEKSYIPTSTGLKGDVNMVFSGVGVGTSQFTIDKQN